MCSLRDKKSCPCIILKTPLLSGALGYSFNSVIQNYFDSKISNVHVCCQVRNVRNSENCKSDTSTKIRQQKWLGAIISIPILVISVDMANCLLFIANDYFTAFAVVVVLRPR